MWKKRVKKELLESYAADKVKSLTTSFGMGKLALKKQIQYLTQ